LLGLAAYLPLMAVITNRLLAADARRMTATLGPIAAASTERPSRLRRAARAIQPAIARLDRVWREHSARIEARLAAAEQVIAAAPDPLILIDRQRRIVGANAAAAAF